MLIYYSLYNIISVLRGNYMIVRFSVENFRSFKNKVIFDFVSNSHIPQKKEHKVKFGRLGVVKNLGIFGANASGKTTIISAIKEMRNFIVRGRIDYNLAFKGRDNKPTVFAIIFESDKRFFQYSYSLKFNKTIGLVEVVDESLYELFLNGKAKEIYSLANGLPDQNNADLNAFVKGYKNTFGTLFLNYIVAPERNVSNLSILDIFRLVYDYFLKKIFVVVHQNELMFSISEENVKTIKEKLHEYDTGIENVDFVNLNELEKKTLSDDKFVRNNIILPLMSSSNGGSFYYSNDNDIFMFKKGEKALEIKKLLFKHTNIKDLFSFKEESEGTKIVFCLIATLLCQKNGERTVLIDEIERSSHPSVVKQAILDFQRCNAESNAQLVFSTHLASLMDSVLQRDEIYFVHKDDYGVSHINSLQQYKTRNRREQISEKYLEGRYGSIPKIGVNVN